MMKTIEDPGLRSSVLHSIEKDLRDLEIVISPSEVNLVGFTPFADTAKHRQHILEKICTLRCPRCQAVSHKMPKLKHLLQKLYNFFRHFSITKVVQPFSVGIHNARPISASFVSRIAAQVITRKITLMSSSAQRILFPDNCTRRQIKLRQ